MAKYKFKNDISVRGNAFFPRQIQKPGEPNLPRQMPTRVALIKNFKKGAVVEGNIIPGSAGTMQLQITTDGAITNRGDKYAGQGNFNVSMALLDEVSDPAPAPVVSTEVAKVGATTTATPIDWKKVGIGASIGILFFLLAAYLMKKRNRNEMIIFGLIGAAIGGLYAHFSKSKAIDKIAERMSGTGASASGSGSSAGTGDLPSKLTTLGKKTFMMLMKAFGADKDKAKWDEMNKAFDDNVVKIKEAYATAVSKLTADEKKAVDETATFTLKQLDSYPAAPTQAEMEKFEKVGEAFSAELKKKYPGVDVEGAMERTNKVAGDMMGTILQGPNKGPVKSVKDSGGVSSGIPQKEPMGPVGNKPISAGENKYIFQNT